MAPRLKILMSPGSKKRTQIYFFFSIKKNPAKRTPSGFPNRTPVERDTHLQGICVSLENLIKIPLIKKALRKKRLSMFPQKTGPVWKQIPISEPCLTYFTRSPVKAFSHKVPFMESLAERYPVPRALIHLPFKVPGI